MSHTFRLSLQELERSARVRREQQTETQAVAEPVHDYVQPEDLDRIRLVAAPESAGRLDPRR